MQHLLRLIIGGSLAILIVTYYMTSDPPYITFLNLLGLSADPPHGSTEFKYINESSERIQDGYLVWSSGCRIVDLSPWDKSVKGLVGKSKKIICPGKQLSKVTGQLHNRTLELSPALQNTKCCLHYIVRKDSTSPKTKNPDDIYKISKCQRVNLTTSLPENSQFIWVKCTSTRGKIEKEVYTNMHGFIAKNKVVEDKLKIQTDQYKSDKLSVLLIGIDSISRLNLIRTMPKTVKYLDKNGWINLKGYNKIDDNTFPNLMAILTGRTVAQIRSLCWPRQDARMDNCPIIWKEFSDKGYITAYAEDEALISTFNYHKQGFAKSPTDFYLRPLMLAAESHMNTKKKDGLSLCTGPKYSVEYILDYAADFTSVFHNALYFALFWMNSFSHNDVNLPSTFDDKILKFLKDIEKTGTLNTTMVVFLSDHGMRFGKIRQTFSGWLEERLPFIYFWIPKWFRTTHSDKFNNLLTNQNRLTSPYDLHLTLKEIVGSVEDESEGCKNCDSLLNEVQWNRTCEEAGVGGHWCTCSEYKTLSPQGEEAERMAQSVVDHINDIVNTTKAGKVKAHTGCANLTLSKVLSYRSRVSKGPKQVVLLLRTNPGGALFEATLAPDQTPLIVDTISRINSYNKDSFCVNDATLKKYCYCKTIPS